MDANKTKTLVDSALADLEAQLRAGKSDTLKAMLEVAARFHNYSFRNQLLIAMQRPDATRVAGFNAWKQLGRHVKKGERGIAIIAPMVGKKRDDAEPAHDAREEGKSIFGFRGVYVFDIAQTEGEPLPEISEVDGDPAHNLEALRRFATAQSISLEYTDDLGGALGLSRGGSIAILTGQSPAREFAVLAHELAHELLHRDPGTRPASKTVRETEAESVAFIVCRAVGLDTNTAAADYIQLYDGSVETLSESLERIHRASSSLISALNAADAREGGAA